MLHSHFSLQLGSEGGSLDNDHHRSAVATESQAPIFRETTHVAVSRLPVAASAKLKAGEKHECSPVTSPSRTFEAQTRSDHQKLVWVEPSPLEKRDTPASNRCNGRSAEGDAGHTLR